MVDQKFRLGEKADIIVGPQTKALHNFYQAIGFNDIQKTNHTMRMTDGSITIVLGDFGSKEFGVVYYTTEFDSKLADMREKGIRYQLLSLNGGDFARCVRVRNRQHLNLILMEVEQDVLRSPELLMMDEENIDHIALFPNQKCGIFGELSLRVDNLVSAIKVWERLGYDLVCKYDTSYPWAIVRNELGIIGLHQNSSYDKQTLSYFARDMEELLDEIKKNLDLKLMPYGDQPEVKRAGVLITPNLLKINLFSL